MQSRKLGLGHTASAGCFCPYICPIAFFPTGQEPGKNQVPPYLEAGQLLNFGVSVQNKNVGILVQKQEGKGL